MTDIDPAEISALRQSIDVLVRVLKITDSSQVSQSTPKLNPADMQAILFVADRPNCIVSDLVGFLKLPPTTISALLNRLEKYGIVLRRHTSENRRVIHLQLTEAGEEVAKAILAEQNAHCARMLSALDERERRRFIQSIVKIAGSLD